MRYGQRRIFHRSALPDFKVAKFFYLSENRRNNLIKIYRTIKGKCRYKDFNSVPVGKVMEIRNLPERWTLYEFIEVYRIIEEVPHKKIMRKNISVVFRVCNFVLDALRYYEEKERTISRRPDAKMVQAGIEELYPFGDLICLRDIVDFGGANTLKEAAEVDWGLAFSITATLSKQGEIRDRYMKLLTKEQ